MDLWDYIQGFSKEESWGKPERLNGMLLLVLDAVRTLFREKDRTASFIINNAYATRGHAPKSQHYRGNAADFHIKSQLPFWQQILVVVDVLEQLQLTDRVGLGIYPDWRRPGFHLDVRGSKARWGKINGKPGYVSFEEAFVRARVKEAG